MPTECHPPVQPAALVVEGWLEVGLLPRPPPRLLHRLHVVVVVGGRAWPLLPAQAVIYTGEVQSQYNEFIVGGPLCIFVGVVSFCDCSQF